MKIKNIKINNYGNLENKEINLENKINIIYGKNESGKSTLLNYIKNIFYGISKNKNGKEISDYEKYKPWMKEEFSGKLKYELDNGKIFEIFRDFNKKNPKIFNDKLEEISNEFNIVKKDGVQFFYDQTNVDESMFLSTVVSMQQEVKLNKQEQSVLVQKIANLAGTGEENVSFKKILDKLNKVQVDEIGTDRTQGKPINIIKNKMKDIMLVLKTMNLEKEKAENYKNEKSKIINEISILKIKNNILEKINKFNSNKKIEEEKIKIKNKIKNENEEKINKLNLEKNNLLENKKINDLKNNNLLENNKINNLNSNLLKNNKINNKKYLIILFLIIILLVVLKLINLNFGKNKILNYIIYLILPIYFIYIFIKNILEKNKIKKEKIAEKLKIELEQEKQKLEQEKINHENILLESQIQNIDNQIQEIKNKILIEEKELKELQLELDEQFDYIINEIKKEYSSKIDIDNFLDTIDFNYISNSIYTIQEEINKNNLILNSIEIEQKNLTEKLDNMIVLQEEYKNLEENLRELEKRNLCIKLTKEYLNNAYEQMKNTITPKFTENLSKNISKISNNKYSKVMINDEKGLIVENDYGEYISADRLSIGTIDQLYLSLRLSMIDELSTESMPIILDEAFAYYDDARLQNILEFLIKRAEKNQIIIFTCTKREQEILQRLGITYNLVELSA